MYGPQQALQKRKALYEVDFHYDGFEWIDCNDTEHSIISFMRKGKDWHNSLIFGVQLHSRAP